MEGFHKLGDDLERVIEKEDTNSSITSDSDDNKHIYENHREHLKHILHSNKFQIGIIVLVIVDCILVIAELLIELGVFEHQIHETVAPHVLHYLSISILSLFMVEVAVKIYAFRCEFFKHKMELFDAIVVIVSFALDVALQDIEGMTEASGLLILLRLWRVTRILNGIIMSVKVQADKKINRERRIKEALEQELAKFREYCSAQEKEIELLRGLLKKHGVEYEKVERPVLEVKKINVVAEVNTYAEKIQSLNEKENEQC